jgi:hypothetical protein
MTELHKLIYLIFYGKFAATNSISRRPTKTTIDWQEARSLSL